MLIALKRQRFGADWLEPGDEIPHEPGRNYNAMIQHGLAADVGEQTLDEESHKRIVAGHKARETRLENLLEQERTENAALREQLKQAGVTPASGRPEDTGEDDDAEEATPLAERSNADLEELAKTRGVAVPARANKKALLKALTGREA